MIINRINIVNSFYCLLGRGDCYFGMLILPNIDVNKIQPEITILVKKD